MLFAAVAVFGLSNVNAQEVSFGVKAGVNFANVGGDDLGDNKARTGFHLGGVAEIAFSENMSFQPELLYSSVGYKYKGTELGEGGTYKYDDQYILDYITLPLMGKYYVMEGLSLEFGPQVGFLISAKNKYDYTISGEGVNISESGKDDVKDFVKGLDFGLNIGAGYKLPSGLNFAARYSLGLSNLNDIDNDNSKVHNNVIQLSVGFMF